MSVPPPSGAQRELVVRLEEPRGWRRRGVASDDVLRFTPDGLVIEHDRALVAPLVLPLASLALASVDPGPAKTAELAGRLPVLRRLSKTAVVPREEGIEGWLWTSRGGSVLPSLAEEDAPNGVLLFTKPLAGELVTRSFSPEWVEALAARSPLGEPAVLEGPPEAPAPPLPEAADAPDAAAVPGASDAPGETPAAASGPAAPAGPDPAGDAPDGPSAEGSSGRTVMVPVVPGGGAADGGEDRPEQRGWQFAHWAVANASALHIEQVSYAGRVWTAGNTDSKWRPVEGGGAQGAETGPGAVRITSAPR